MKSKLYAYIPGLAGGAACLIGGIAVIVRGIMGSSKDMMAYTLSTEELIAGTALLLGGGILVIVTLQRMHGNSAASMPSELTAEIIGVAKNLRMPGEPEAFHIVCRWADPDTGETTTFSSEPLPAYPGREVIGKTVTVHLDPGEAGAYHVDLDTIQ